MSGYRYYDGDDWEALTPYDLDVLAKFETLHSAMSETGADWLAMLARMRRDEVQLILDFEYDDPERWKLKPQGIDGVREFAMSLRLD